MTRETPLILRYASSVFSHFACLPSPSYARTNFRRKWLNSDKCVSLVTGWSQLDPTRKDRVTFSQEYLINFENNDESPQLVYTSPESLVSLGACFPYSGESGARLLWDIEKGMKRLFCVEYKLPISALGDAETLKASAATPGTFVHVHCKETGRILQTIKLPTEMLGKSPPVHGRVFGPGSVSTPFTAFRFCPVDETKVAFLAEAAPNQRSPKSDGNEDAHIPEYSPFLLKETWGEGLSVITTPVLCTLDLETGKVECIVSKLEEIDPAAKNWSFDDPHYTPDGKGMVFVVYDNQPYRLGLIYCHQRAARLMYWDFESSNLRCLSRDSYAVRWPRFSPNGSKLVWFEVPSGGPHGQCFEMHATDWPPKVNRSELIVPLVANPKGSADFPGLYLGDGVQENCWTADSKSVVLSTQWGAEVALVLVNLTVTSDERIVKLSSPLADIEDSVGYGSVHLMEIRNDILVVQAGSPTIPTFLAVAKLDRPTVHRVKWLNLSLTVNEELQLPRLNGLSWKILEHSADTPDERFGVKRFESILISPTGGSKELQFSCGPEFDATGNSWDGLKGLIVLPHGGPHSAFSAEWLPGLTAYIAAGFAVLLVNYRGSTGYGNASIYCLPGNCGSIDVADCVQATREGLAALEVPEDLPCLLYGGSHGGFLVLHLAGRHAPLYRAVVARNPVTNLVSMLATTDIPDWCWTEAGLGAAAGSPRVIDPDHPETLCHEWSHASGFCPTEALDLERLAKCSPIAYITSEWSVPLLMCLGQKDLRVPNEQGIAFMRTLSARLGEASAKELCCTLRFPTEAHPIECPAAAHDNFLRALLWFYRALGEVASTTDANGQS